MLPIEGKPILTAAQMRAAEERAAPTPDAMYALMERAGAGVADAVRRLAAGAEVLVLCGPGNNGGDGYVAARLFTAAGLPVRVAATGEPATALARRARARWLGDVHALAHVAAAPVLVDALFGTGLTRPLDESVGAVLRRLRREARLAIAVDVPSGVNSDSGVLRSEGSVPPFDLTLALGALKPAHLLMPAAAGCGAVRLLDLGLTIDSVVTSLGKPTLPMPDSDSHKFTRGLVAVIAGAMPGAGALAATAAARAGAGYVLMLGSATDRLPHAIVRRRWSADALADPRIGAVVIGPGLGCDDAARERFEAAWASAHPLVIDGDALRLLDPTRRRAAPVVLTPHAGEFAHLFGDGQGSKLALTQAAAERAHAIVIHKGADTVVAAPDGRALLCPPASAWLSTAGTGDVLAGAVGAVLAGGAAPLDAAAAGVWLHAEAARRCGSSFIADDLAAALTSARASCR